MFSALNKLKIAVLFGGVSTEHEVSLISATYILKNLQRDLFEVLPIGISKDGRWFFYSGPIEKIETGEWVADEKNCKPVIFSHNPNFKGFLRLEAGSRCFLMKVDCVFFVLHGRNGEDGRLQGFFEAAGVPFVGCGTVSSANCMDKQITHIILEHAGIKMAKFETVFKKDLMNLGRFCKKVEKSLKFPVFVKPANSGSSVGISKCKKTNELEDAILKAFQFDCKVICEQAIEGCREVECAVLGNENPEASVIGEIKSKNDFYDYDSKYKLDSQLLIPAQIDKETAQKVQQIAIKAFETMECSGLARVDFLIDENNEIFLNEINTMPGFTKISMYPMLWKNSGIEGKVLIKKLVDLAIARFEK